MAARCGRLVISAALSCAVWAGAVETASASTPVFVAGVEGNRASGTAQVIVLRSGDLSVVTLRPVFEGDEADFALVIPLLGELVGKPGVTVPRAVVKRVDRVSAPRLVEFYERDPCAAPGRGKLMPSMRKDGSRRGREVGDIDVSNRLGAGEYTIKIVRGAAARDAGTWLADNQLFPTPAARAVIDQFAGRARGFLIARVNERKVTFSGGGAELAPLRFAIRQRSLDVPIAPLLATPFAGAGDLLVYVITRAKRATPARPHVATPVDFEVNDEARHFSQFYGSLVAATLENNPGAVVIEYVWPAMRCESCSATPLSRTDMLLLGADMLDDRTERFAADYVLTRLRVRPAQLSSKSDLSLSLADPVRVLPRYSVRTRWTGPATCDSPVYDAFVASDTNPSVATTVDRGALAAALPGMLREPVEALAIEPAAPGDAARAGGDGDGSGSGTGNGSAVRDGIVPAGAGHGSGSGCACEHGGGAPLGPVAWIAVVLMGAVWRRRVTTRR